MQEKRTNGNRTLWVVEPGDTDYNDQYPEVVSEGAVVLRPAGEAPEEFLKEADLTPAWDCDDGLAVVGTEAGVQAAAEFIEAAMLDESFDTEGLGDDLMMESIPEKLVRYRDIATGSPFLVAWAYTAEFDERFMAALQAIPETTVIWVGANYANDGGPMEEMARQLSTPEEGVDTGILAGYAEMVKRAADCW